MHPIILVDDEPSTAAESVEMLVQSGFDYRHFTRPQEALCHLTMSPASLLITDLRVGGMSGFQLFSLARRMHPFLRGILLAPQLPYEEVLDAIQSGFDCCLLRPLDHRILLDAVNNCHERYMLWSYAFDQVTASQTAPTRQHCRDDEDASGGAV